MCSTVYIHPSAIVDTDQVGPDTKIWAFVHVLKGAVIGAGCNICDHCYIEGNVRIGDDVVVKNGVSLWEGVTLEDGVFVGPNVAFTNDLIPRAKVYRDQYDSILVKKGASIGANATLIGPLTVGSYAIVGAGSVIRKNVPDFGLVCGNPAVLQGWVCACGKRLDLPLVGPEHTSCECGREYVMDSKRVMEKIRK